MKAALPRVPFLAGADAGSISRLGGLTNRNFLVEHDGGRCVLRLPGVGTEEYIGRVAEAVAAQTTAAIGINVPVLHFDASDGLMVTRFADDAETLTSKHFDDPECIARVARSLRRLHTAPFRLARDFGLFDMIDTYRELIVRKGAPLFTGLDAVQAHAAVVRAALEADPVPMVPCHCDLVCENLLDTGEHVYVIDYDYSGNNDPMWDLGDLSTEAGFDPSQEDALLHAYFDGPPPAVQRARMVMYKAMCDLLWSLWGIINHVNGNPTDDYWAYGLARFERCRALMASSGFAAHLDVLR